MKKPKEYYVITKKTGERYVCAICGELAEYIAPETMEFVCAKHLQVNDEARRIYED